MHKLFQHWRFWRYYQQTDTYYSINFIYKWLQDNEKRVEPGCVVQCMPWGKNKPNKRIQAQQANPSPTQPNKRTQAQHRKAVYMLFTHVKRWEPEPYLPVSQ